MFLSIRSRVTKICTLVLFRRLHMAPFIINLIYPTIETGIPVVIRNIRREALVAVRVSDSDSKIFLKVDSLAIHEVESLTTLDLIHDAFDEAIQVSK